MCKEMILEPIAAGLVVAIINRFVINNAWLWQGCQAGVEDHDDSVSSYTTSVSSSDLVLHH